MKKNVYSAEFRDEAIKVVLASGRPIAGVARDIGVREGTLTNWVNNYRREHPGDEKPLEISERARLRELEKENIELRMERDFLKKAASFFAKNQQQ
jgi:transposase